MEDGSHGLHDPLKNKTAKAFLKMIRAALSTETCISAENLARSNASNSL